MTTPHLGIPLPNKPCTICGDHCPSQLEGADVDIPFDTCDACHHMVEPDPESPMDARALELASDRILERVLAYRRGEL